MILSWVLTFLLFIVAFVFSLIYGPRQEIADYTAIIFLVSFIVYASILTIAKAAKLAVEVSESFITTTNTTYWTFITAFLLAMLVRRIGIGHIFDKIFIDFARVYFP